MVRRTRLVLVAIAVTALQPSLALTTDADALVAEGNRLRRAGNDEAALEKFQRAHELAQAPKTAAQVGLCMQALGRFPEAEDHLTAALANGADPWVTKNRRTLEDAMLVVKEKIARLDITGQPANAEVRVDGRFVGRFPLGRAIRVSQGMVEIEVRAPGHKTAVRALRADGGQYKALTFVLDRDAPMIPPSVVAPSQPSFTALQPAATDVKVAEPVAAHRPLYARPWFWIAVGAVVVAGLTATLIATSGDKGPRVDGEL